MNKISPILQDLRLELYELTTLDNGQYIMRGVLNGASYAASPSLVNDLLRRLTNNNRDRYQDRLNRCVDKLIEYAELLLGSSILNHGPPDKSNLYAVREFGAKVDGLETCFGVMQTVFGNLDKVKAHYVQIQDAQFALKIDDLRSQLQKAAAELLARIRILSPPQTSTNTSGSSSGKKL